MTWKLARAFFWLRKKLGRWTKNRERLTGEMLVFCKIEKVNFEGKAPTDLKVYFDTSLELEQCQLIAQEVAGSFLNIRMKKKEQEKTIKKLKGKADRLKDTKKKKVEVRKKHKKEIKKNKKK